MSRPVWVVQRDDDLSVYATEDLAVASVIDLAADCAPEEWPDDLCDDEVTRWSFEALGNRVLIVRTNVIGE